MQLLLGIQRALHQARHLVLDVPARTGAQQERRKEGWFAGSGGGRKGERLGEKGIEKGAEKGTGWGERDVRKRCAKERLCVRTRTRGNY